jgi:hypothetical protein
LVHASRLVDQRDQPIRVRKRQRLQQNAIHDAKDCARRADPDRERQDGRQREGRTSPQAAQTETEILDNALKPWPRPCGANVLGNQHDVAQLTPGRRLRLLVRQPIRLAVFRLFAQMEFKFLLNFGFSPATVSEPLQLPEKGVHADS